MITFFGLVGFALILLVGIMMFLPMAASVLLFSQPVECRLGEECFIQNYVDVDPSEEWKDYRCGSLSYDGHKGTDFRVPSLKAMQDGVRVLAAAEGEVVRLRDGMADISFRDQADAQVADRECGNGIVIKHRGGFETQYCHLKQGSLLVKQGDKVTREQPIAEIGLSGKTEFPHVHFEIRNAKGEIVDPFLGVRDTVQCNEDEPDDTLWTATSKPAMRYIRTAVLDSGFYTKQITAPEAYTGEMRVTEEVPYNAPALVFWATFMGAQDQDALVMQLVGPDGKPLVNYSTKVEGNKAQMFQLVGKKAPRSRIWPAGEYKALGQLLRGPDLVQQVVAETELSIQVPEAPETSQ